MSLATRISLALNANYTAALDLATGSVPLLKTYEAVLATGTGAGQADSAGYAVTATTADLLHVANSSSGTSVTYDVIVIGTSA